MVMALRPAVDLREDVAQLRHALLDVGAYIAPANKTIVRMAPGFSSDEPRCSTSASPMVGARNMLMAAPWFATPPSRRARRAAFGNDLTQARARNGKLYRPEPWLTGRRAGSHAEARVVDLHEIALRHFLRLRCGAWRPWDGRWCRKCRTARRNRRRRGPAARADRRRPDAGNPCC